MRSLAWLALACALTSPALADPTRAPRPYTIEDMLSLQNAGRAVFSGDGASLVFQIQGPLTEAGKWDLEFNSIKRTGRLYVVDVAGGGLPRRLLNSPPGTGESLGALSPDGRRLIVYRLRGHANELGVVDLKSGKVRWSGQSVDAEDWFSLARWRSDREVVALVTTPDTPSFALNRGWQFQARTRQAWDQADAGKVSVLALHSGLGAPANPAWPDCDLVAFDVGSGAVRPLARGPFLQLALAPDGKTAALPMAMEDVTIDGASIVRSDAFSRRRRLRLVNLETGEIVAPCVRCDMVTPAVSWSPDSQALLLAARPDMAKAGDWGQVRYWRVSLNGEASIVLPDVEPGLAPTTGGAGDSLRPDAGWIGAAPVVLGRRGASDTVGWWRAGASGPVALVEDLPADGGRRLAQIPDGFLIRTSRGVVALGAEGARTLAASPARALAEPPMAGDLSLAVQVEAPDGVRSLTPDGQSRQGAPTPAGASLLALSPASGANLTLARSGDGVGSLLLSELGHPPRLLATLNAHLAQTDVAAPRPIVHRTPRGDLVTSWLYLPAGHQRDDERALIVVPYPGSTHKAPPAVFAADARTFTTNVQVMVGQGYGVLVPSLPLPPTADPSDGLADAILAAVDAALAAQPGLSRTQLAIWGHSFGGYGALVAATQSPRFKAIVATAGVYNLFSMYGEQGPRAYGVPEVMLHTPAMFGWSETSQGRMLSPPWLRPERYIAASPLLHADKINAPVLVAQGDLDVGGRQSLEMFSALYRQGKPATLLYYPGEGHSVQSPGNVRDFHVRTFAFLQAALSADRAAATVAGAPAIAASRPSQ